MTAQHFGITDKFPDPNRNTLLTAWIQCTRKPLRLQFSYQSWERDIKSLSGWRGNMPTA